VDLFMIMLFLHVLGAIVAFGPGFAAMVVGPMVAREPQYANFYARSQVLAGRRLVSPVSISLAITGVAMIALRGWPALTGDKHWLEAGILLYVVAVVVAMAVQAPAGRKLVELTSVPPPPGAGPSPELLKTASRVRWGGMLLSALVVAITFLMIAKPV
jgi:uncharacterized membrane protein